MSHIGYIDLSKRRVSPEDITKCEDRYMKAKTVASIMRHVATKTGGVDEEAKPVAIEPKAKKETKEGEEPKEGEEDDEEIPIANEHEEKRLLQLYEQIAWPLADKYGHTYDAFKVALTYVPPIRKCTVAHICLQRPRLRVRRLRDDARRQTISVDDYRTKIDPATD